MSEPQENRENEKPDPVNKSEVPHPPIPASNVVPVTVAAFVAAFAGAYVGSMMVN